MQSVDLSQYNNQNYKPGSPLKRLCWYFVNEFFFNTFLPFPSSFKVSLLRIFGAKIGASVVIKPSINIKYPWYLEIGDHSWIGENVWIDNLTLVKIGRNVVVSQGAYLLTGNHDYKKVSFDLIRGEITLEDGVWIGAKSTVCPSIVCHSHSILAVGSVAATDLDAYMIYQGNPAKPKKQRVIA